MLDVPYDIDDIYEDLYDNEGSVEYQIRDYGEGMGMDNAQSMKYFLNVVAIPDEAIIENHGTQVWIYNDNYDRIVIINAGGLGDFYSHKFKCEWVD